MIKILVIIAINYKNIGCFLLNLMRIDKKIWYLVMIAEWYQIPHMTQLWWLM